MLAVLHVHVAELAAKLIRLHELAWQHRHGSLVSKYKRETRIVRIYIVSFLTAGTIVL
jgi:hypothetical protein